MSIKGDWATMTSSKRNDHPTPQWLFDELDAEFSFEIDLCASADNAKCPIYISEQEDFISHAETTTVRRSAFMNPPYQRKTKTQPGTGDFVEAAYRYSQRGATVVCLLPSRTGTAWFHDYALPYGEIRWLKGRLTFEGSPDPAPFDSVIVIFRPKEGNL